MPEGMIFQAENQTSQESSEPAVQAANPVSPDSPPPVPVDHSSSRFPLKTLLKIALAVFTIVGILFIIFTLILPGFHKTQKSGNVTLTYWGLWEDENVMNPVIADFEKENPSIKVKYEKQDLNDYREKLTTRIGNGSGPDIFRFHNSWYPMLANDLIPFPKETIGRQEFSDNYYKVAEQDLVKNGAIYGIPLEIDTLALFVNTQIFSSASSVLGSPISVPKTWQEFIDVSQKLTTRDENGKIDIAGGGIGTYENVDHAPDIISLLFAQNGVNLADITKSSTKISDALTFYTNFALIENNVWDATLDNSLTAFSKEKLAMFFGYSRDYFAIKSLNPDINFKIVPVPQLLNSNKANIASYWAEGVSVKSVNQKEALLFMKFLAKKETQEKLYSEESKTRLFVEPYGNKNLADKLRDTDFFTFVDQADTAVSSPFVDGTFDNGLNDKLNNYLRDSVNAMLGSGSEQSSVETLLKGYSRVIGQYGTPPTSK